VWRRQAELAAQYLSKGSQLYVEGKLSQSEYTDKDGNTRTSLEVNATDIQFLGSKAEAAAVGVTVGESSNKSSKIEEDEIPF
jgi:single-strand DNA-binding protein